MDTALLKHMANQFKLRSDMLSLEVLKFVLARPVYRAKYLQEENIGEFAIKRKNFIKSCQDAGKVILYGAGGEGIAYISELQQSGVEVLAFLDSFKTGIFCGKPIISLQEYKGKYSNIKIVITPVLKKQEIRNILERQNINNYLFFDSNLSFIDIGIEIPDAIQLSAPNGDPYFSLQEILWKNNEVFVDCGVYGGETILDFMKYCKSHGVSYDKIFGFEPDPLNYQGVIHNLSGMRNIEIFNAGVGNHNGVEKFVLCATGSHVEENGDTEVNIVMLDELLQGEHVTFIKMDIEGSELDALKGAAEIIRTQRPKLAICVYHKDEDIWEIPKYIWSLYPDYQFFLRHYSKGLHETVLYALP